MCDFDIDDPVTVLSDKPRIARKRHRCDSCDGLIQKGEAYRTLVYLFEGDLDTDKQCFPCWASSEQFKEHHGNWAIPSYFPYALRDCIADNYDYGDSEDEKENKQWRSLLAGMLLRKRAAKRVRINV